jgi:hypothetical protein
MSPTAEARAAGPSAPLGGVEKVAVLLLALGKARAAHAAGRARGAGRSRAAPGDAGQARGERVGNPGAGDRGRSVVAGHDLTGRSASGERVARWMTKVREIGVPADGDLIQIGDMSITICPWWDGPATCAEVGEQLARDARRRGRRWIRVYHAPPEESPLSWTGTKRIGDSALLEWIHRYAPDVVLTGHIHQAPFRQGGSWADRIGSTWVFNPGRQIGPNPTHVIVDLDEQHAKWFSQMGDELVRLDRATVEREALTPQ